MSEKLPPKQQWAFYDRQSSIAKARAAEHLRIIETVELLVEAGMRKSTAIKQLAPLEKVSASSIWSWFRQIDGVSFIDRQAYLIPRFKGGGRKALVQAELLKTIADDYMRPEQPSWNSCVQRAAAWAEERGIYLTHGRTLKRQLERHYSRPTIAIYRGEYMPNWLRIRTGVND